MKFDQVNSFPDGVLSIREIMEDGSYHRRTLIPGSPLDGEPEEVVEAAQAAWSAEVLDQWQAEHAPPPPTAADVDAECDRRTALGFAFGGKTIQSRPGDLLKITGAATSAGLAVSAGAAAGNLRWADPDNDFVWIAADNTMLPLDAPTMIAMGQTAMAHVSAYVFAARSIKDRIIAGEALDPVDDALWPGNE